MANSPSLSNASASAAADAVARHLDNGYLRIYSGTKPTNADTALAGNTLLAELRFANPSAPGAVSGVVTFSTLTPDSAADATATATFFRTFRTDGTTVVYDGTVGTSSADLLINSTAISAGTEVSQSSPLTYTQAKA